MPVEYRPFVDPLVTGTPVSGKPSPRLPFFGRPVNYMKLDSGSSFLLVSDPESFSTKSGDYSEAEIVKKSVKKSVSTLKLSGANGEFYEFTIVRGSPKFITNLEKRLKEYGFEPNSLTYNDIFARFLQTYSIMNEFRVAQGLEALGSKLPQMPVSGSMAGEQDLIMIMNRLNREKNPNPSSGPAADLQPAHRQAEDPARTRPRTADPFNSVIWSDYEGT